MAKTACMVNPLVYVCHNSDFKIAFRNTFQSLRDNYWPQSSKKNGSNCSGIPLRLIGDNGNVSSSMNISADAH